MNAHSTPPSPTRRERLRRVRARRRRRGVALIMVLGALAILTVMLTETQDQNSSEFSSALAARDQLAAEYAAKSAVNLTRLLIAAEPTIRAPLTIILAPMFGGAAPQLPVWGYADQVLGAFNDQQGNEAFASLSGLDLAQGEHLGMEGASFQVLVIDEDSKINVNLGARSAFSKQTLMQQLMAMMQAPSYDALFSSEDADGQYSDRQAICSAIIDWTDSDQDLWPCDGSDTAQQTAPEDSFYERLDKPYTRKNAAFDSFYELYRVRGISEDFWATFVEPDPDNPAERSVTVWGGGTVNVNSANAFVLLTIICQHAKPHKACEGGAETGTFLSMVSGLKMFMPAMPLFGSPKVFVATLKGGGMLGPMLFTAENGLPPFEFKSEDQFKKEISTESKVFSIYATGRVTVGKRETQSRIHTVVDFREAPAPGQAQPPPGEGNTSLSSGKPSPAGNIVYYRVD